MPPQKPAQEIGNTDTKIVIIPLGDSLTQSGERSQAASRGVIGLTFFLRETTKGECKQRHQQKSDDDHQSGQQKRNRTDNIMDRSRRCPPQPLRRKTNSWLLIHGYAAGVPAPIKKIPKHRQIIDIRSQHDTIDPTRAKEALRLLCAFCRKFAVSSCDILSGSIDLNLFSCLRIFQQDDPTSGSDSSTGSITVMPPNHGVWRDRQRRIKSPVRKSEIRKTTAARDDLVQIFQRPCKIGATA